MNIILLIYFYKFFIMITQTQTQTQVFQVVKVASVVSLSVLLGIQNMLRPTHAQAMPPSPSSISAPSRTVTEEVTSTTQVNDSEIRLEPVVHRPAPMQQAQDRGVRIATITRTLPSEEIIPVIPPTIDVNDILTRVG